ncbi:hypothetical protein LINPERHAP1_LOCUS26125, partial [Linum perenne]
MITENGSLSAYQTLFSTGIRFELEIARMRPPRRPKKRPRIVQKYMDFMFPGLWLTEVITDLYKVTEVPESR